MNTALAPLAPAQNAALIAQLRSPALPREKTAGAPRDVLQLGAKPPTHSQSMNVVLERAMDKLRAVVNDARAALGIPEGAAIDTSAEATATRIADFALGAFDRYRANHEEMSDDEARSAFVEMIGAAIDQGIEEARGILTALSALNPEIGMKIGTISEIVHQRLDAFLANE